MFNIKNRIFHLISRHQLEQRIQREQAREAHLIVDTVSRSKRQTLTRDEESEVKALWGKINPRISMLEYEIYKGIRGFDTRYLAHHTYLPLLARRINNYRYTKLFEHKSLLGYLSNCSIRFPECYVRCIDGEFYSGDMRQLSLNEAVECCIPHDCLIYKASTETSGGKSVKKISLTHLNSFQRTEAIKNLLRPGLKDYVIQENLSQHSRAATFNVNSVNTFRVTTLYLNGTFSVLSIVFRFGTNGMTVDNLGAGGIMVGVKADGSLTATGYNRPFESCTSYNGINFSEYRFPEIPAILKEIEEAHVSAFPLCKLIGWDICIDENGHPVVLELNSSQPGVSGSQICNGPIFGERTAEVIQYCLNKPFRY